MIKDVFPPYNLPDEAVPWGREAQKRIIAGENSEVQLTQKVDNGLRATAGQLSALAEQINSLATTVGQLDTVVGDLSAVTADLSAQVARLNNAGIVQEASNGTPHSGTGWRPGRPSVTVTSLSGRFLVSIFGTSAGATSFFTYSAPGKPRTRIEGSGVTAETERISAMGGVSNTSTAFGAWVYTGAINQPVTFTGEGLGTTEFSASGAVRIQVQPLL